MKNRTVRKIFPVILSIALAVLFSFVSFSASGDGVEALPDNYETNFQPSASGFTFTSFQLGNGANPVVFQNNTIGASVDGVYPINNAGVRPRSASGQTVYDLSMIWIVLSGTDVQFDGKYFSFKVYYPDVIPINEYLIANLTTIEYRQGVEYNYFMPAFYKINIPENSVEFFTTESISLQGSTDIRVRNYLRHIVYESPTQTIGNFKVAFAFTDEPLYFLPVDEQINGKLSAIINDMNNGFASMLESLDSVIDGLAQIQANLDWLIYNVCNNIYGLSSSQNTVVLGDNTYTLTSYQHLAFSIVDEHVQQSASLKYGTYLGILYRKLYEFFVYFRYEAELTFQWFYPLKSSTPQYWRAYNTDTDSYDAVNPAGVTGYITWYLGKLYEHLTADIDAVLETPVENTKQAIADLEQAENNIKSEYLPKLQAFNPDSSNIGTLAALPYFTNYLQRIFTALGAFNIPIIAALTLGICMQLIGYFKYKE